MSYQHPSYPIQEIKPKHQQMVYMVMCGKPLQDIAEELGMSTSAVSYIVNSPLFQGEVNRLQKEVEAKVIDNLADPKRFLNGKAIDAARKLVHLMNNSESENIQMASANSILDRAGAPKINKVESEIIPNVYIDNRVMRLLLVSKLEAGLVPAHQQAEVEQTILALTAQEEQPEGQSFPPVGNNGNGEMESGDGVE